MFNFHQLCNWVFFVWLAAGVIFLLPKKIKLMKRAGIKWNNAAELIRLAKEGDLEAQKLRKKSMLFMAIGILVLVPLRLLSR